VDEVRLDTIGGAGLGDMIEGLDSHLNESKKR
jgi:hypothetical protein